MLVALIIKCMSNLLRFDFIIEKSRKNNLQTSMIHKHLKHIYKSPQWKLNSLFSQYTHLSQFINLDSLPEEEARCP